MGAPGDVSAWRAWSEAAPADLREDFNRRTVPALRIVRHKYPSDCGPRHPQYMDLRRESVHALDELAIHCQEEYDHALD